MKKKNLAILAFILSSFMYCQEQYSININDKKLEIELDKEYEVEIKGNQIKFSISSKDTLTYKDDLFSFNYPKEYKVSKLKIEVGIEQLMLMNAEGSGYLIQKYSTFNPTMLNEMMMNELTKESINYGFSLERKDYTKILSTGKEVHIDKAVLTYKDEINIYEIMSYGKKDEGIMLVTMSMSDELSSDSKKLISMMWNSLSID